MYHDFESHTITRRSFLKGAGAVGAAGLLAGRRGGAFPKWKVRHRSQRFVGFFRCSCFRQGPERAVYLRDFWP